MIEMVVLVLLPGYLLNHERWVQDQHCPDIDALTDLGGVLGTASWHFV